LIMSQLTPNSVDRGMAAQLLRLLLPKRGREIATTFYFRAAEKTLGSIGSIRGVASKRASGSDMTQAVQRSSAQALLLFS
jgi:hypothetical protein